MSAQSIQTNSLDTQIGISKTMLILYITWYQNILLIVSRGLAYIQILFMHVQVLVLSNRRTEKGTLFLNRTCSRTNLYRYRDSTSRVQCTY